MSALKATILIASFSILSKLLGAVRQAVFAHAFGAGVESDIYVAAFRVPDLLFNLLILGTLSVAFIPVFVDYLAKGRKEAFQVASTIFNLTLILMAVVALLGMFFSPLLVKIIVPGFSRDEQAKTALMTQIMLLSPLFFSLSSVLTSVLQSFKRFVLAAIAPLFYNFSVIIGIVYLYPRFGLKGVAWGVVLGAFLHFAIQFPATFRLGLRPFEYLRLSDPGVRKIGKLFFPRIFGVELGQIALLVASVIGSFAGAGSLAVFYFAYDLETVPLGVFAISFAIAAFPTMAELYGRKDKEAFKTFFSQTVVQVLFLMIPISVLTLLLRAQIVRLILGAGSNTHFTFSDTKLTAQAMGFFALSLFAQSLVPLLARGFYALQNTIIPVLAGFVAAVVDIVLSIIFTRLWGPTSMALAFSIGITVQMIILFAILHRRLHGLRDDFLLLRTIKICIASIVMGIMTFITLYAVAPFVNMSTYLGVATQTMAAGLVATLSYFLAGLAIKLPETKGLLSILQSWFGKFSKPVTAAIVSMFTDLK
jgi:putative peptidoglycan lipid II flippase